MCDGAEQERRWFRNEYSIVCAFGGQRQLPAEEVGRYLFGPVVSGGRASSVLLRNGGRLHLDVVSCPEYAKQAG